MNKPSDKQSRPMDEAIARLMGLGERSIQKSYYPQLRQKIRELEKSRARYRLLAENISDVIWMLDPDGVITYVSPSVARVTGYQVSDLVGTPFARLLAPESATVFADRIATLFTAQVCDEPASDDPAQMELVQISPDGAETWIEIRLSCSIGNVETGRQILGVSRDITARKEAEQEKEKIAAQLLQAQKMESVGTLAGGIAHDFNNLLTIINGYARLALDKIDPDHFLYKKLSAISHAGERAGDLTRQLLAFSRKQIIRPEILDINQTIGTMDRMLRRLIGEDIHVETCLDPALFPISADPSQIGQIFTNLVVNARDALAPMQAPGFKKRITIETGQSLFKGQAPARLGLPRAGRYVYFSVSDNGQGMGRQTQKRIFEPFFTTKSKHKGTGLGLAMVYGIVKQNQGSIRVYSEPGQGSLFKIYWPAAESGPDVKETALPEVGRLSGHERILLVEDNAEVLGFAANALKSLGYEIHTAGNGRLGLSWIVSRIAAQKALPHVVVTDLIMPELNGKDFVKKARALVPGLRVIYVSGHTDNHIVHDGLLEEGLNFLQKPYSQQQLAGMIRKVLENPRK